MDAYQLFQEFMQLEHQIDEYYHELAVRQGLSDSAMLVLWALAELGEGCTQRDICGQFALSKQTVNSCVRKLAREGVLSLRPGTGREVRVYPTDRGRALLQTKIVPIRTAEQTASLALGEEGLSAMLRFTRRWFEFFQKEGSAILNP